MAGAIATGFAVTSVHPLDTLKTILQSAPKKLNPVRVLVGLTKRKGVGALYAGIGSSISSQVPAGAIKFAVYESLIGASNRKFQEVPQPIRDISCAALAFFACSFVLVPGEVIKQRMQAGLHKNVGAAINGAVRGPKGVFGIYQGYRATLLRDIPYTMLEYGSYAGFKRSFRKVLKRDKLQSHEEWLAGGLAGGCTGLITTPLDVAKTRLMTQSAKYSGIADVLVKTAKSDGVQGLFRGSSARVAWLVPFTAIFFGVHEASKRMLLSRKATFTTAKAPSNPSSKRPSDTL